MHAFDIRITGEVDDEAVARELAGDLIGELLAGGSCIHHASMNGQEIRVRVERVEVKTDDPDRVVAKIAESMQESKATSEQLADAPPAPTVP